MWICVSIYLLFAEYKDGNLLLECRYPVRENCLHYKIWQCFRTGDVLETWPDWKGILTEMVKVIFPYGSSWFFVFLVLCVQLCEGEVLHEQLQGMQQAAWWTPSYLKKLWLERLMITNLFYQLCLLKSSNVSKGLKYPSWTLCILPYCVYTYGFCCKLFFWNFQNITSTGQPALLSQVQCECSPVWPMTGRADGGSGAGVRWEEADSQEQPGAVPAPAYILSCCVTWAPEQWVGEGRELS